MKNHKPDLADAQARACAGVAESMLRAVFAEGRPADRELAGFFRRNKKFGSRDRRSASETVFAIFRWWGLVRKILPQDFRREVETRRDGRGEDFPRLDSRLMARAVLCAAFFDDAQLCPWDVIIRLCREASVDPDAFGRGRRLSLQEKMRECGRVFDSPERLEKTDMFPGWVAKKIQPGFDADKYLMWSLRRPPLWIRLCGGAKCDAEFLEKGVEFSPHPRLPNAVRLSAPSVNIYETDSFRNGRFEVQDAASQCVSIICDPAPGQRWWDACAGGGGKTLHLAELMKSRGTILSTDLRGHKLDDLKKRARRHNYSNIRCDEWDGGSVGRNREKSFDGVLVDAPCTCSGTWRRNPDAKWRTLEGDVDEMSALQRRLLSNASKAVRPGGRLVYATCSVFRDENEVVALDFLENHKEFELEAFDNPLTGARTEGTTAVSPWDSDCDSLFVCRMRRKA